MRFSVTFGVRGIPARSILGIGGLVALVACGDLLGVDDYGPALIDGGSGGGGGDIDMVGGGGTISSTGTGVHDWAQVFGAQGMDDAAAVAVGEAGVVVTGEISGRVDMGGEPLGMDDTRQLYLAVLGSDGTPQQALGTTGMADPLQVTAIDALGDRVAIAGCYGGEGFTIGDDSVDPAADQNAFVVQLRVTNSAIEVMHATTLAVDGTACALDVALTETDLVVVGESNVVVDDGLDAIVWRVDMAGVVTDTLTLDGPGDQRLTAAVTAGDDVYVAGDFGGEALGHTSAGSATVLVAKLNGSNFTASAAFGSSNPHAVAAIDVAGDQVAVVGSFFGGTSFGGDTLLAAGTSQVSDIFVLRLDSELAHQASFRLGAAANDRPHGVAVAEDGRMVVVGEYAGEVTFAGLSFVSVGEMDGFVAAYDADDSELWWHFGRRHENDAVSGVALDDEGILVTGRFFEGFALEGEVLQSEGNSDGMAARLLW